MIILISGVARCGKDSMTQGIILALKKRGIIAKRYAFADELKKKLDPLFLLNHGISAFTEDAVEKPLIRPILLAYGQMCRQINNDFWVDTVAKQIKNCATPHIAVVSDCRYPNEINYFGGEAKLIHVTRLDNNGVPYPPIGKDEETFNSVLEKNAAHKIVWENSEDNKELLYYKAEQIICDLFEPRFNEWKMTYPLS
jgi:hypothetical protein